MSDNPQQYNQLERITEGIFQILELLGKIAEQLGVEKESEKK